MTEIPDVCTVELPPAGGRVIIASDGVWDALPPNKVAAFARKYPDDPHLGCERIIKKSLKAKGFRDDTTVIIVDVLPQKTHTFHDCMKLSAAERQKAKIVLHEDITPSDFQSSSMRKLPYDFKELEGVKIQSGIKRQGAYLTEDGFMGKQSTIIALYSPAGYDFAYRYMSTRALQRIK